MSFRSLFYLKNSCLTDLKEGRKGAVSDTFIESSVIPTQFQLCFDKFETVGNLRSVCNHDVQLQSAFHVRMKYFLTYSSNIVAKFGRDLSVFSYVALVQGFARVFCQP